MSESNTNINLFDFIPLNEENINKFSLFVSNKLGGDNQASLRRSFQTRTQGFLDKEMFYIKDSNDKTFIETLLEMDKPSSYEEIHVRVYLLSFFFERGLQYSKGDLDYTEKRNVFMEQVCKVTEKYYEDFCTIRNFTQKKSVNDYAEQLNNIVNKNKPVDEIKAELKEVLKEFYTPFDNTQINNAWELIAPMALTAKIATKFNDKNLNLRTFTTELYFETIEEEYQYAESRSLLIEIGSTMMPDLIKSRFLLPKKEGSIKFQERNLVDHLSLTVLTDLVSEMLLNNKIMMSYETLNLELNSDDKVKTKKHKL